MLYKFLLIASISLLSACSGASQQQSGLTPMPDSQDPKDSLLFDAITSYVAKKNAPPNSTYDFVRIDLNGDGLREGIVLFKLPHTYWCGWDGCGMMVFKAGKKSFTPLSSMSGVRGPIYVSSTESKNWRDIIVRLSGTNLRDKDIIMRFDGRGYPQSPMLAPPLKQSLASLETEMFFR
jgi:hypothetical protein